MHFDHIPAGMKPVKDETVNGGWKLVALQKEDPEDLKIMYEEAVGREQCLIAENQKLIQLAKFDLDQIKNLKVALSLPEKEFNKLISKFKK